LPEADLFVWDFDPGMALPNPCARPCAKHAYLVARKDLEGFDATMSADEACIILKPVNRGILSAFFSASLEPRSKGASVDGARPDSTRMDGFRAERDSILQYALETNLKLQEYDESRTNFLARALHDFRAPLTALRGYCELLLEGQLGLLNQQQENLLQSMLNSARRLQRLTSGMFELSVEGRVERTLQLEEAEIENCVYQAIHELTPFVQEKGIAVEIQMNPPEQPLLIDPHQIEQVLVNLVENSCRFTPRSGDIDIRGYSVAWDMNARNLDDSSVEPNAYRIDVRDSGPGIEPHLLDKVFEQYTSYSGGSDRSGGGLGLAICRMIVETHGGAIWVQSGREGAVFSFVLPFEPKKMASLVHPGADRESSQRQAAAARVA
jgi:signal transduction histidine kinase